ncbi:LPS assembly lipoprotein LptE [Ferrimonas gelatinilytica]|uniref:LPS-assembly lipoprotein LptE n=1 Tax=Ferrimonas gelatinilytica TaxID=1255257 RepID=A0ABP9S5G3_9GAMM
MFRPLLSLLLCATLLTGCGFHLQGSYLIPDELNQMQLRSDDHYGELHRLVRERLRLHQITLVEDETAPMLRLDDDRLERSTLSLFPSGQVAEYELIYTVRFSVILPEQEPQRFNVEIRRDYLDDPRTALAKTRELELLLEEMREQAADRLLRTLATIRNDKTSNSPQGDDTAS